MLLLSTPKSVESLTAKCSCHCYSTAAHSCNYLFLNLQLLLLEQGGAPNYFPNSFGGSKPDPSHIVEDQKNDAQANSTAGRYLIDQDFYSQPKGRFNSVSITKCYCCMIAIEYISVALACCSSCVVSIKRKY
jgi:hypothetical protein